MMRLLEKIKSILKGKNPITEVIIERSAIKKICGLAKDTHPKEFLAYFEGNIKLNKIIITDIIFQPYVANENSTWGIIDLPLTSSILGSVHSHPSYSNRPSDADLHTFSKHGIIHGIIKKPYREEDLQLYSHEGEPVNHEIRE